MKNHFLKYEAEELDEILDSVHNKTIYDDASTEEHGLMSPEDKVKLNDTVMGVKIGEGNVLPLDSEGVVTLPSYPDISGKADKVTPATNGNFAGLDSNGNLTDSGNKPSDFAAASDVEVIAQKIPVEATTSNKLADKAFVNSSITTATATFRGTYNLVTDLSLDVLATHNQVALALSTAISTADNNDYVFVQIPTTTEDPTVIDRVDRYKYNGSSWDYEWSLNNSSFTASQWAAINSGISAELVTAFRNKYDKPQGGIPASDIAAGVIPDVIRKEDVSNKVTRWGLIPTHEHYPSERLVKESLDNLVSAITDKEIDTIIETNPL